MIRVLHTLLQGSSSLWDIDAAVCSCDLQSADSLRVEERGRVERGGVIVVESVSARFLA